MNRQKDEDKCEGGRGNRSLPEGSFLHLQMEAIRKAVGSQSTMGPECTEALSREPGAQKAPKAHTLS